MKKALKWIGIILAIPVTLVACGAAFIFVKGVPSYPVSMPSNLKNLKVDVNPQKVLLGQKTALIMCVQCHQGKDEKLSGKLLLDMPKDFGSVYSPNITQSTEHGIGKWTDGEIIYFLRTGIKPSGQYAPPYMPKFPNMADDDIQNIVAYLRSSLPEVQPSNIATQVNAPNFMTKMLSQFAFLPLPYPTKAITVPDSTDKVAFGRYIANDKIVCYACHSSDLTKVNSLQPEKSFGFYAGGTPLLNEQGEIIPSANLTFDAETGIGNMTEQQFIDAVKYCKNPRGGNPLRYPMIPHVTLSDYEVSAIYAYLQTIPKISNKIAR